MNKILIVAATYPEIKFLEKAGMNPVAGRGDLYSFKKNETLFNVLITGAGMVAATFHLTSHLQNNSYRICINAGIAGSFDKSILIGSVVNIIEDKFADIGAEDYLNFISVFDLGLTDANEFPFTNGILKNKTNLHFKSLRNIKQIKGVTINTTHGNEDSIKSFLKRYEGKPQTESMEGAAFAYVCLMKQQPFIQLRAISNYIEKRNRDAWQIGAAINNLEKVMSDLMNEIAETKF